MRSSTSESKENSTFTVDSTLDNSDSGIDGLCDDGLGNCTLRAAIQEANGLGGSDNINFDIPDTDPGYVDYDGGAGDSLDGDDYWSIAPNTVLPVITDVVVVDGSTQKANQSDTNTFGPEIQISGINYINNTGNGLSFVGITGSGSIVNELNIINFGRAIYISSYDLTVTNSYLNPDAKGLSYDSDENQVTGVYAVSDAINQINTLNIGLENEGNAMMSELGFGVWLEAGTSPTEVQVNVMGNKFGLDPTGTIATDISTQHHLHITGNVSVLVGEAGIGNRNYFANSNVHLLISGDSVSNTIEIYNNFFNTDINGTGHFPASGSALSLGGQGGTTVGAPGKGNLIQTHTSEVVMGVGANSGTTTVQNNTIFASVGIRLKGPNKIFRNNFVASESTKSDPYFGVTNSGIIIDAGGWSGRAIELFSADPDDELLLTGNYFDGHNSIMEPYDPNTHITIGGQGVDANSLCMGLEKNCFSNVGNTTIITRDRAAGFNLGGTYPVNYSTIELDNEIIYDIGATKVPLIVVGLEGTYELFSGDQRRTDLTDGSISIPILNSDYVTDIWDLYTYITEIQNSKVDCTDPLDCPGSNGENEKQLYLHRQVQ
ncbi:MAG: hypothetical protein Q9M91_00955 [Candidatus Dojkabacteria bacterium]|nr:hypothetical protein [Candidatus Dojkabacteria bacterium]